MRTFTHLTPAPAADTDPVFAAAVAHATVIAETSDPRAAMRAALDAAGVPALDEQHDVALHRIADLEARLTAAADTLTPPDAPTDSHTRIDIPPAWAGPQRAPAGRRAA